MYIQYKVIILTYETNLKISISIALKAYMYMKTLFLWSETS